MTTSDVTILTDVSEEILATYNLCLVGPPEFVGALRVTRKIPPESLREIEENLTDLLPPGFRVIIREWNE